MNNKLKVVWICPLDFSNFLKNLEFFPGPTEVVAPWMTLLIKIFEAHTDETELHIITAPPKLAKDSQISVNGIHYHFISDRLLFVDRKSPFVLKKITRYFFVRLKVKQIVHRLQPDIIEFHGAEHDLSWSFFDLKYPKILTPQFFVNNYYRFKPTKYLKYWKEVEQKIYKACKNFSYRNEHMKREILALNPKATLYKYQYPIRKPSVNANDYPIKNYDIVFTARLIKSKGIEDLLYSINEVKKVFPGVMAKIIGQCSSEYLEVLKNLTLNLGIEENVRFAGFLPSQEAMFEEVAKSKISVLPTHFDLIPGSILEAMFIGTPVIAYAAGGIPELNREIETVRLVEIGNIEQLTKEIINLLSDEQQRTSLAETAKNKVNRDFDNDVIYNDMIRVYKEIAGTVN